MDTNRFLAIATLVVGALAIIVPLAVYLVQQQSRNAQFFHECAKSIFSDNPIEQSTAAILLRGFLKRPWRKFLYKPDYTREAKNLMVELLRKPVSVGLKKTIADGFSYAGNLKGQEIQNVNMVNALIKPESRIKYELTENRLLRFIYKRSRLSMRKADFFHAVLQECSINNVDAKGAIFFCAILNRTSFKNCILEKANFVNSNVKKVRFDEDCKLEGACFDEAVGLDSATIGIVGEKDPHSILKYLDDKGIFHSEGVPEEKRYKPRKKTINLFVSKLGTLDSTQRKQFDSAIAALKKLGDVEIEKIERDQYPSASQLTDVSTHLEKCDGCVIFAFGYLNVVKGFIHEHVEGEDRKEIDKQLYSSPWLHIEAALANGRQMPCLIIYDKNLCRDGMFEDSIINSDKNMCAFSYSDTMSAEDKIKMRKWFGLVQEYHYYKTKREISVGENNDSNNISKVES